MVWFERRRGRRLRSAFLLADAEHTRSDIYVTLAALGSLVLARLRRLSETGDIRRLGVVVRHRELGYCANAMVVWDVPDQQVAEVGRLLGRQPRVNLCYRRPRRLPEWRFNLFCMIHGHARQEVLEHLAELIRSCGLEQLPHQVLFSRRRFKQCGARYGQAAPRKSRRLSATRREMAG